MKEKRRRCSKMRKIQKKRQIRSSEIDSPGGTGRIWAVWRSTVSHLPWKNARRTKDRKPRFQSARRASNIGNSKGFQRAIFWSDQPRIEAARLPQAPISLGSKIKIILSYKCLLARGRISGSKNWCSISSKCLSRLNLAGIHTSLLPTALEKTIMGPSKTRHATFWLSILGERQPGLLPTLLGGPTAISHCARSLRSLDQSMCRIFKKLKWQRNAKKVFGHNKEVVLIPPYENIVKSENIILR